MQKWQEEPHCKAFISHSLYAASYFLFTNVCFSSHGIQHVCIMQSLHPIVLTNCRHFKNASHLLQPAVIPQN